MIRRLLILVAALVPMLAVGTLPSIGGDRVVLLAAGDIARCDSDGDEATAALLDRLRGRIAALGDTTYTKGSPREFRRCYDPTWGRHQNRTRPAVGNHEYNTAGAAGYFAYFGAKAGDPTKGYYSYDLASWHIIVLNSNCSEVGGCGAGSPQLTWLQADLNAHPATCTLAYWHHPLFSSGREHGGNEAMRSFWQALYDAGADVVLAGHEHNYERFAPQDPNGSLDRQRGIRQFVVGTGGANHYAFGTPLPNSEVRNAGTSGLLKLILRADRYRWKFVPVAGQTFTDRGNQLCH